MELPNIASLVSDSISEQICNSAAKMANNLAVVAFFCLHKDRAYGIPPVTLST